MAVEPSDKSRPIRKSETAFRTIGEVSVELGIPNHVLRYWESRFPQLKPVQRAGNRRYYRPEDVTLLAQIQRLLNENGYSIRGVQKLLAETMPAVRQTHAPMTTPVDMVQAELRAIRDQLAELLDQDSSAA